MYPPKLLLEKQQLIFKNKESNFTPLITNIILEGIESKEIKTDSIENITSFFYCIIDGLFVESTYYNEDDYNKKTESIIKLFWEAIKA
jgi:hypothetical protein